MQNLQSSHKLSYVYLLTPTGLLEKSFRTAQFLKPKMGGHDSLCNLVSTLKAAMMKISEADK